MTPRPAYAFSLHVALFALIFSSLVKAGPKISELRDLEARKHVTALVETAKTRRFEPGSREEKVFNELFRSKENGKLGALFEAWEPGKGSAKLFELGKSELEAASNAYRELQVARGTRETLYSEFTKPQWDTVAGIDIAKNLKSIDAESRARVLTNEKDLRNAVDGLDGKVKPERIAQLLGNEGALRRSFERNLDAAYGTDRGGLESSLRGLVSMEVEAARLARDMNPTEAKSQDATIREEIAAGNAMRDAMRMANGDPNVLKEISEIAGKLNTPENRDAMSGLGIMSRAMEVSRSTAPTKEMFDKMAADILGGGVSQAVIEAEGQRLQKIDGADFASAKAAVEALKLNTGGAKTATELEANLVKELGQALTTKLGETPDLKKVAQLEQALAAVAPAAMFEGSKGIVENANGFLTEGKIDAKGAKSMADLLGKVEAKIAEIEAKNRELEKQGKPPVGLNDLKILRELQDELQLRRLANFMKQNPRFKGMSKIQQFHTLLCEAKAAGKRGPKVLVAAMAIVGLPAAVWSAVAKGKEPTEADYKGPIATREQCEQIAKTFTVQDVSKIALFAPSATGPTQGKPSVSRGNDPFAPTGKAVHKSGN